METFPVHGLIYSRSMQHLYIYSRINAPFGVFAQCPLCVINNRKSIKKSRNEIQIKCTSTKSNDGRFHNDSWDKLEKIGF